MHRDGDGADNRPGEESSDDLEVLEGAEDGQVVLEADEGVVILVNVKEAEAGDRYEMAFFELIKEEDSPIDVLMFTVK